MQRLAYFPILVGICLIYPVYKDRTKPHDLEPAYTPKLLYMTWDQKVLNCWIARSILCFYTPKSCSYLNPVVGKDLRSRMNKDQETSRSSWNPNFVNMQNVYFPVFFCENDGLLHRLTMISRIMPWCSGKLRKPSEETIGPRSRRYEETFLSYGKGFIRFYGGKLKVAHAVIALNSYNML